MSDPRDPRDPSDPTTPPGTPPPPASPVPATPILIERHRLGLGMLRSQVEMDPSHSLTRILSAAPRPKKRTRRIPWVGDQGSTEHCVGFSWYGFLRASPHGITFKGGPDAIYTGAQDYDEFPGKEPEMYGSSVRGGARFLLADPRTDLARYHWAHSVDQVLDWIGSDKGSPVIVGTDWTRSMFRPDSSGLVKVEGPIIGGHAWLLVGYDDKKKLALGQSSWGRGWGRNGRFWLTYSDLDKLLRAQGEACVATRA